MLRDDPATSQPFQFATTRGSAPALSVLVLSEVENWQAVTPEQPLVLRVDQVVADGEHVLPVAWDGEFYLPLGRAQPGAGGSTEIILEQLVQPVATARDLRGSIRILFRKIIGKRLGLGYEYPLLTLATVADDGTVGYERDRDAIRAAVAGASRILLYIHGIIGDTRGMVSSSRPEHLALGAFVEPVGTRYQLLLAFDYENINTPIEETARDLKGRLAAVGLGERHDKTLDVVAHSMGGLAARWMIEREGGDTIVSRLVTLGTPNGGSPWATLETWATTLLALGLNGLAGAFWPAGVLAGLVSALEKVDVALDQMTPQSEFLTKPGRLARPAPPLRGDRRQPLPHRARCRRRSGGAPRTPARAPLPPTRIRRRRHRYVPRPAQRPRGERRQREERGHQPDPCPGHPRGRLRPRDVLLDPGGLTALAEALT